MVVNHSVKLSFDLRFTRLCLKNCMLKNPLTARPKMRLKTALFTKKLYAYNRKITFAIAIPATFAQMSLRAAWQKFMVS